MRCGRAPAVAGRAGAVARRDVAGLRNRQLVVDVGAVGSWRPRVVVVWKVHAAVVPGVSISVEAAG